MNRVLIYIKSNDCCKRNGSVQGHENSNDDNSETHGFTFLKGDGPLNVTISHDTEFDRFMRRRQLIQLFTMLLLLKIDYNIILSKEEDDDDDDYRRNIL